MFVVAVCVAEETLASNFIAARFLQIQLIALLCIIKAPKAGML